MKHKTSRDLTTGLRKLATASVPAQNLERHWGVIQGVSTDGTVTLTMGGSSATVTGVKVLSSYSPIVGDTVMLDVVGSDVVVVGTTVTTIRAIEVFAASAQTLTTGAFTKLNLDSRFFDSTFSWDITKHQLVIPRTGGYAISAAWTAGTNAAASPLTLVALFVGGNELRRGTTTSVAANINATITGAWSISLVKGTVIDIRAFQNSGGNYVTLGGSTLTYCDIQFLGSQYI